jgi:hypothetical protein
MYCIKPLNMARTEFRQHAKKNLGKSNPFGGIRSTFSTFAERPSHEKMGEQASSGKRIGAHDLFSLFTADIIKEDALFVR